ncbi:DUF3164 family protein [Pseudaestuariivita sp.]|uniref:DUF3164 family protein n=1 Tax=Pseudaestuariivita sp. TaxID=2211669 RepID=UPI004059DF0E
MNMHVVPEGYMKNARGELIPEENIKPAQKLQDELVRGLMKDARRIHDELRTFKALALSETLALRETVAQDYDVSLGGQKGNVTLRSFDGTMEVQIAVQEHVTFGPELSAAKELIDNCVTRWSEGANSNVRALVDHAFQVNKTGKIDTQRVLSLRQLNMAGDPEWHRAMDAIADAIIVTGSKTYIRFYEVDPKTERKVALSLDIAKV